MNNVTGRLKYYEFCYPDISRPVLKDYQHAFSEYGCMEAVDVEFNETRKIFECSTKKQRPLLDMQESRILIPKQPILPLGKPPVVGKLLHQPCFKDYYHGRRRRKQPHLIVANIEEQLVNLSKDHPDVAQGTFVNMLSHYFPYQQVFAKGRGILPSDVAEANCDVIPTKFLPRGSLYCNKAFPKSVDPYMFDIPYSLLNELLQEEMEAESKKISFDPSFTGGCLSYQHIDCSNQFQYGVIVRPQSQAMDQLSLQLLCTDTTACVNTYNDGDAGNTSFDPNLHLGSDYRMSLKGRVLQTNVAASVEDPHRIVIGARSQNHVVMVTLDGTSLDLSLNDENNFNGLTFSSSECVKQIGVLRSSHFINSMSVNPYIDGECVVSTDDGSLYLWDARLIPNCGSSDQNQGNGVEKFDVRHKGDDNWSQIQFASHPRQVFVASRGGVDVLDMRGKYSRTRVLWLPEQHCDDLVMTILSGEQFSQPNEFQCLVATTDNLLLMDQRYCKAALLKWHTNMRYPCQHLASVGFTHGNETSDHVTMVLAANQRAQEVHSYQYKTRFSSTIPVSGTSEYKVYPPHSISHPMAVGSLKDVRRSIMGYPNRNHGYITRRLNYPLVGVAGFSYFNSHRDPEIAALQVSECGDLFYQTFRTKLGLDVYRERNIISETTCNDSSATNEDTRGGRRLAKDVYEEWADLMGDEYQKEVEKENPMNLRCTRTTLQTFKYSADTLTSKLNAFHKALKGNSKCPMCSERCMPDSGAAAPTEDIKMLAEVDSLSELEVLQCLRNGSDDENEIPNAQPIQLNSQQSNNRGTNCLRCGSDVKLSQELLRIHSSGVAHPARGFFSDADSAEELLSEESPVYQRPQVEKLDLINPAPSESGLGRVLVSTWYGSYENFWENIKEEGLAKQERERQEKERAILDLSGNTSTLKPNERKEIPADPNVQVDLCPAGGSGTDNMDTNTLFNNPPFLMSNEASSHSSTLSFSQDIQSSGTYSNSKRRRVQQEGSQQSSTTAKVVKAELLLSDKDTDSTTHEVAPTHYWAQPLPITSIKSERKKKKKKKKHKNREHSDKHRTTERLKSSQGEDFTSTVATPVQGDNPPYRATVYSTPSRSRTKTIKRKTPEETRLKLPTINTGQHSTGTDIKDVNSFLQHNSLPTVHTQPDNTPSRTHERQQESFSKSPLVDQNSPFTPGRMFSPSKYSLPKKKISKSSIGFL